MPYDPVSDFTPISQVTRANWAASSSRDEFAAHVKRELARWTGAARSAGIRPE